MALPSGRDVLVVVAHPDDEVLWLSAVLPYASSILAAFSVASRDPALTEGRELVRSQYPFGCFAFLGLQNADVFGQSDFLSRVPVEHGVSLMSSCVPERVERYRSNYCTLLEAVDPYLGPRTDIYTHNPWGEYGHEEHIQVNHAMVELAVRHGCSVWVWDGLSSQELVSNDVWLRADYYPDDAVGLAPSFEVAVDLDRYLEIRALYQRHGSWTWQDDYLPPTSSRLLQIVRDGHILLSARTLSWSRRAAIAGQIVSRKARHYTRKVGQRVRNDPLRPDPGVGARAMVAEEPGSRR